MNLIDNTLDVIGQQGILEVGGGIPAEIQIRFCDPKWITKLRGEGSGLGLDIVRQLIQRQVGEICVERTLEHTTFRVQPPLTPKGQRQPLIKETKFSEQLKKK